MTNWRRRRRRRAKKGKVAVLTVELPYWTRLTVKTGAGGLDGSIWKERCDYSRDMQIAFYRLMMIKRLIGIVTSHVNICIAWGCRLSFIVVFIGGTLETSFNRRVEAIFSLFLSNVHRSVCLPEKLHRLEYPLLDVCLWDFVWISDWCERWICAGQCCCSLAQRPSMHSIEQRPSAGFHWCESLTTSSKRDYDENDDRWSTGFLSSSDMPNVTWSRNNLKTEKFREW